MSNKYGSTVRRFISSAIGQQAINPPADFTMGTSLDRVFMYTRGPITSLAPLINPDSRLIVQRIGLYHNFADGLVLRYPYPISLKIRAEVYDRIIVTPFLTGVVSMAAGTKAITGGGTTFFNAQLVPNDVIILGGLPVRIATITDDNNATACEIMPHTVTSEPFVQLLGFVAGDNTETVYVNTLNDMYECSSLIKPELIYAAATTDFMFLSAIVKVDVATPFLTKSIDTSYSGDSGFWTVEADVEFTQKFGD